MRGTITNFVPGWNLDNVDRGSVANDNWGSCREGNSWYGYNDVGKGSINTTLRGCGVAKLDFGQCLYSGDSTQVNLNGKEIGRANDQLSKTIEFNFKDGDILELKQSNFGFSFIRFNSFTVISCC